MSNKALHRTAIAPRFMGARMLNRKASRMRRASNKGDFPYPSAFVPPPAAGRAS